MLESFLDCEVETRFTEVIQCALISALGLLSSHLRQALLQWQVVVLATIVVRVRSFRGNQLR